MFYIIPNELEDSVDTKKVQITGIAYERVIRYAMTPTALNLSQYLQTKYKKDLKTICKNLILTKITINSGGENGSFIVTYKDLESDDLAKLITYGNSEVKGCNILKFAFNQDY